MIERDVRVKSNCRRPSGVKASPTATIARNPFTIEPGSTPARRWRSYHAVGVGVLLTLGALFAAGVEPWQWWRDYLAQRVATEFAQRQASLPEPPRAVVQPVPIGTDSSVQGARPLVLTAIHPGRNVSEGHVELEISAISPQTYRAGAVLANGARIEAIYADHIVLTRGSEREELYVGRPPTASPLTTVGGGVQAPAVQPDSVEPLDDFIRVTPVYAGDALEGIEVYANETSAVFADLGLEPGDRITAIDGAPVTDAEAAITALRRLSGGAALQVTVDRAGRQQDLSLDGLIVTTARAAPAG
ncbi:MAG: PDZ domain-containing protein [Steroidobacteraceae bacterium]